jgi:hypothetical protein
VARAHACNGNPGAGQAGNRTGSYERRATMAGTSSWLARPLSRGSGTSYYPVALVAHERENQQNSGWNLPPLALRAVGAHGNWVGRNTGTVQ